MSRGFEAEAVVEVEKAVVVRIDHKDFDGDIRKWQELYFQILSWKNTWSMAYEVDMLAYNDHSAYVYIVAKAEIKEQLVDWLKSIGYNKISHVEEVEIGTLEIYADNDDDIYKYYYEW